jgi:hypothetical protein
MHTALVSRLLKDRSLWEETTDVTQAPDVAENREVSRHAPRQA